MGYHCSYTHSIDCTAVTAEVSHRPYRRSRSPARKQNCQYVTWIVTLASRCYVFVNNIKEVKEMDERELELYEMSQEEMERIANGEDEE